MNRIGIDIGGTHTDAVLVSPTGTIIAATKSKTTRPIELGVKEAIKNVLTGSVSAIYIGTTHATNAILEYQTLSKVGLIRIAGQKPAVPPCFGWPKTLVDACFVGCITIDGGFECDGREISRFNLQQAQSAIDKLIELGAESIAVVGAFSSINQEQEQQVGALSPVAVSLSAAIGGLGFIERENATIINAALKKPMEEGFSRLEEVKLKLGLKCPMYLTQNNGSLITLKQALETPLLTLSCGPTNSFIGACKLVGLKDAVVIDIGGTSTDIGVIQNGFPRRSLRNAMIGGVKLNFRMPDVLALSIGGGSIIRENRVIDQSVGRELPLKAESFGGNCLTLTDIAFVLGKISLKEATHTPSIDHALASSILAKCLDRIDQGIKMMSGKKCDLPVILVGGGATIAKMPDRMVPVHHGVANAYGAAFAEISHTIDTCVQLKEREKILRELKEKAAAAAIEKGACPKSISIVDVQTIPYHYIPGNFTRVIITASGASIV